MGSHYIPRRPAAPTIARGRSSAMMTRGYKKYHMTYDSEQAK